MSSSHFLRAVNNIEMYTVISLATFCLLSKLALWAICSCGPALGARAHLAAPKEVLGAQSCGGCLPTAPWTLSNQTLCARAVAGQAAAWRSRSHVRATRPACSSHHAIEEVAEHSGDCAAVPQAHRRRRRRASYHRKPCHLNPLQSLAPPPLGPPHPLLGPQRRLASARRCSRRSVDGTAFGAGRSASCRV